MYSTVLADSAYVCSIKIPDNTSCYWLLGMVFSFPCDEWVVSTIQMYQVKLTLIFRCKQVYCIKGCIININICVASLG